MSLTTLTTTPEFYDETRIERAGELLNTTPEAPQNPANTLDAFRLPSGQEVQTDVFVPRAPVEQAPATYGARIEAAARNVAEVREAETSMHTEIIHAGDAVYKIRIQYLESPANVS